MLRTVMHKVLGRGWPSLATILALRARVLLVQRTGAGMGH